MIAEGQKYEYVGSDEAGEQHDTARAGQHGVEQDDRRYGEEQRGGCESRQIDQQLGPQRHRAPRARVEGWLRHNPTDGTQRDRVGCYAMGRTESGLR